MRLSIAGARIPIAILVLCVAMLMATGFPDPAVDDKGLKGDQTAVLAGGCFWCVEAVFQQIEGVKKVVSGYSGGDAASAHYEIVSTGRTGHAESVQITFDPQKISYGQVLKVFFDVAHDPTQLNRQGPDTGPQYRSAIFYSNPEQKRIAEAYISQLDEAKVFRSHIVTQVVELKGFFPAEEHHQNFCRRNPRNPYVMGVAMPKVQKVRQKVPELAKQQ
ncbi:MAG: peptide-methionine (S)-S-oxide reductase MsrA [Acidobacteriia bacterium]|nr:peptide-methionine (S)-S-oxide reductase MsrA [Terriglobia bacterium]